MKRPQFDVGFAYAAHALARRAEEVHVRLAANGVECASRFEIAGRSGRLGTLGGRASALVEPGRAVADSAIRGTARTEPVLRRWPGPGGESTARESMAPTEPALPIWRGTIAGPASSTDAPATDEPRTSGLVIIPGPLTRGRR